MVFREGLALEQDQFLEPLQEIVVAAGILPAPQRVGGDGVGRRRAAEPEVDASWKQRLEHLEAFGHHERRMVGKHTPPEPTRMRVVMAAISGRYHDLGRGACDRRQVVISATQ